MENCVIVGAGPSGLAVAGRLRKAGIDFKIIEKSKHIANSWRKHYDRLHLHTVKKLSALPFLPFPESYPTYIAKDDLVSYYESYAKKFDIQVQLDTELKGVEKIEQGWSLELSNGESISSRNVVFATGINRVPFIPKIKGQELWENKSIHSVEYKNPNPYIDKRVVIIGMGNTGAEISLDLAEKGIEVYLSVRNPVNIVPRDLNGRPVQTTSKMLAKLPFGIGEWIGAKVRNIYFGDLSKYGLHQAEVYPVVQLRNTGKTPVIDIGTVKAIKEGKIKVIDEITELSQNNVITQSGEQLEVDHIIYASGYRSKVDQLVPSGEDFMDAFGHPSKPIGEDFHDGLYFIGFNNYELGGILGTIVEESRLIAQHLIGA